MAVHVGIGAADPGMYTVFWLAVIPVTRGGPETKIQLIGRTIPRFFKKKAVESHEFLDFFRNFLVKFDKSLDISIRKQV
ncbi:MAG: hypothetical protein OSJ58_04465 [Dysosmobacter sp.]|uniref:hypothetical protein n=1 Tax=uncultured Oscillibacter sp. TaxID=876091 RepID=UPI00262CBB00|nr:hypothetical protein [uncultured Oscillibacter sp.]MCX4371069.1 hypothetical protein [Dysosmobacter sp.]